MLHTNGEKLAVDGATGSLPPAAFNRILLQLISRVESLLNEECAALADGATEAIEALIERKSSMSLEMTRLAEQARRHVLDDQVKAKLTEISEKLARSGRQIRRHIEAVEEIARVLADIQNSSTSDGTYTIAAVLGMRRR